MDAILNYVDSSRGLTFTMEENDHMRIAQKVDGKEIEFDFIEINEVLRRSDSEGKPFLQLNFKSGMKVLVTDQLIGFKPFEVLGLDMSRLPKVVTTPDLQSVREAFEEALGTETSDQEVEVLRKVYQSILTGAERAGFELPFERAFSARLLSSRLKASA